jgi:hypothetical protein
LEEDADSENAFLEDLSNYSFEGIAKSHATRDRECEEIKSRRLFKFRACFNNMDQMLHLEAQQCTVSELHWTEKGTIELKLPLNIRLSVLPLAPVSERERRELIENGDYAALVGRYLIVLRRPSNAADVVEEDIFIVFSVLRIISMDRQPISPRGANRRKIDVKGDMAKLMRLR